ncbi:MAG: magnesium transporter [Burkholderiaceae bacterium]
MNPSPPSEPSVTPTPTPAADAVAEASRAADAAQAIDERTDIAAPADHEVATQALQEVQQWLQRLDLIREMPRPAEEDERASLVDRVNEAQLMSHLRARLQNLHSADIAYVLEALPPDDRQEVWGLVTRARSGEILLELGDAVRESVIESMDETQLLAVADTLDADDLVEIADDLPEGIIEQMQERLTERERKQLREALSADEDSVGAHMDFDLVTVREDITIETVFRYLRRFEKLPPQTDSVFVVDRDNLFKGVLPTDLLLVSEPEDLVERVMVRDSLSFDAPDDVYEAAQAFERYDLLSAPVLDDKGHLLGRLVVSDIVDIIREEGDSELLNQAGLIEEEDIFASVWDSARNRWLWLALNLCTAFFASRVIGLFEGTIGKVVALAALMPIVAGIAGNSGNQTMTLVVRSMALGQLNRSNLGRLFGKEITVALLNGLMWGSVAGVFSFWLYSDTPHGLALGITMMMAMMLNLLLAAIVALGVPLLLQRLGRDPAMGSPVLLTFSTDSLGFFIFLGLASLLFR